LKLNNPKGNWRSPLTPVHEGPAERGLGVARRFRVRVNKLGDSKRL
jgi:hypothetical protein